MAQAGAIGRLVQDLQKIDSTAAPLAGLQDQMMAAARELHHEISRYADKVEMDPERLRELEERLNLLHSLKRKYGASLADVIAFGEEAARKLGLLEGRDAELARLNAALAALDLKLAAAGRVLTEERHKVIPKLARAAMKQLDDLGFRQSRFDVAIQTDTRIGPAGFDTVEFQFAPNPGEPARPLRAIASSGEMARVMLALKTVLAAEDEIPVLVFDEVDANVGGETAHAVGEKMRHLGKHRQVLCVTHLPQVAAQAQAHFEVTKESKGGRTISRIRLLPDADRVTELGRILGGQSTEARKHAQAMMRRS
jgi:DNA repair protein RecN (Recombination protein N)